MSRGKKVTIRLKHSLPADMEINAVLPDTLEEVEDVARDPEQGAKDTSAEDQRGS